MRLDLPGAPNADFEFVHMSVMAVLDTAIHEGSFHLNSLIATNNVSYGYTNG